jgi:hypothetical protein
MCFIWGFLITFGCLSWLVIDIILLYMVSEFQFGVLIFRHLELISLIYVVICYFECVVILICRQFVEYCHH